MLVLASASPRRRELLENAGIPFVARPARDVDETPGAREKPEDYVQRVASEKALAVPSGAGEVILGADTVVVIDGKLLGKPADDGEAARMLTLLSGRRHEVLTGICLLSRGHSVVDWAATEVWFTEISEQEIRAYVASGEPRDKAGAYAIQGRASRYVERINGEYTNVVGLPVGLVSRHLHSYAAL